MLDKIFAEIPIDYSDAYREAVRNSWRSACGMNEFIEDNEEEVLKILPKMFVPEAWKELAIKLIKEDAWSNILTENEAFIRWEEHKRKFREKWGQ